ncbi:MAG: hypothetical protein AAF399_11085 [Bacteroidota bacterium]
MKTQSFFLFGLALLLSLPVSAQKFGTRLWGSESSWRVKSIDLGLGVEQDMVNRLSFDYLKNNLRDADALAAFGGKNFESADVYSMICENPHLRLGLTLESNVLKNTELRIAGVAILNRIDAISYYNDQYDYFQTSEYLNISSYTNEVAGEIALVKSAYLTKFFRVFGGAGTNLGFSMGNYMNVNASNMNVVNDWSLLETGQITGPIVEEEYYYDNFDVRSGIQQRVFGQVGFGLTLFRKLEFGMEGRFGAGYRYHFGGEASMTRLNSFAMTARWML